MSSSYRTRRNLKSLNPLTYDGKDQRYRTVNIFFSHSKLSFWVSLAVQPGKGFLKLFGFLHVAFVAAAAVFWKCDIPDSRTVTLTPLAQPNHIARKLLLLREMEKATPKRFSLLGVNAEHDLFLKKNTFFPAPWKFPFRFYLHSFLETQQNRRHTYTVCVSIYCRSKRCMFVYARTACLFAV